MSCLMCKKWDPSLDKITESSDRSCTPKDDLIELYGDQVKYYIAHDSSICKSCKNILKKAATMKTWIWKFLTHPYSQQMESQYKTFVSKFSESGYSDNDLEMSNERTPTPLLSNTSSVPYNELQEERWAQRERMRSLSRSNNYSLYGLDAIPKKKRRKGFRLTYRKCSSVRNKSYYHDRSRSRSRSTEKRSRSTTTVTSRRSVRSLSTKLSTQSMFTRSLARELVEEGRQIEKYDYYCSIDNCDARYNDMDFMDQHNIYEHKMRRLHFCEECMWAYTTANLLTSHKKKKHHTTYVFCMYCKEKLVGVDALEDHMKKHSEYSVDCKYCNRSFLSVGLRDQHAKIKHRGSNLRKKKIEKLILGRIDKPGEREKPPKAVKEYEAWCLMIDNEARAEAAAAENSEESESTEEHPVPTEQESEKSTEVIQETPTSSHNPISTSQDSDAAVENLIDQEHNSSADEVIDQDGNTTTTTTTTTAETVEPEQESGTTTEYFINVEGNPTEVYVGTPDPYLFAT